MPYPFKARQPEYSAAWADCVIRDDRNADVQSTARKIIANRPRYDPISKATGVPWYVIGIMHSLECSLSFKKHLHNGDSLDRKTWQVPANRPAVPIWPPQGEDPFVVSAIDALTMKGKEFHKISDWSVERIAYVLETYNGFGYVARGIQSPYLWSFTNQYRSGKYVKDGLWSKAAVSQQCGGMALLKALMEIDPTGVDLDIPKTSVPSFPKAEVQKLSAASAGGKSFSVRLMLVTLFAKLVEYAERAFDFLPEVQAQADSVLAPLNSLSSALKWNIAGITTSVVAIAIIIVIYRHSVDKAELKTLKGETSKQGV